MIGVTLPDSRAGLDHSPISVHSGILVLNLRLGRLSFSEQESWIDTCILAFPFC